MHAFTFDLTAAALSLATFSATALSATAFPAAASFIVALSAVYHQKEMPSYYFLESENCSVMHTFTFDLSAATLSPVTFTAAALSVTAFPAAASFAVALSAAVLSA